MACARSYQRVHQRVSTTDDEEEEEEEDAAPAPAPRRPSKKPTSPLKQIKQKIMARRSPGKQGKKRGM